MFGIFITLQCKQLGWFMADRLRFCHEFSLWRSRIFPQQRKRMGSSAQICSGVCWCRRRVRFNEVPEGSGEGSGRLWCRAGPGSTRFRRRFWRRFWRRFRRRFRKVLVQSRARSNEASSRFRCDSGSVSAQLLGQVPANFGQQNLWTFITAAVGATAEAYFFRPEWHFWIVCAVPIEWIRIGRGPKKTLLTFFDICPNLYSTSFIPKTMRHLTSTPFWPEAVGPCAFGWPGLHQKVGAGSAGIGFKGGPWCLGADGQPPHCVGTQPFCDLETQRIACWGELSERVLWGGKWSSFFILFV